MSESQGFAEGQGGKRRHAAKSKPDDRVGEPEGEEQQDDASKQRRNGQQNPGSHTGGFLPV